jgi:hypothetical protein
MKLAETVLALVLLDFSFWITHVVMHKSARLWRFHAKRSLSVLGVPTWGPMVTERPSEVVRDASSPTDNEV